MNDYADFDLEKAKLARRRAIAEKLISTAAPQMTTQRFGDVTHVMAPGTAELIASSLNPAVGQFQQRQIDQETQDLARRERENSDAILSSIPAAGEGRQQAQLKAMRTPSLRDAIKAQMGFDEAEQGRLAKQQEAEAARIERGEQLAQDRVTRSEERALDRENQRYLRSQPTVHISTGGGSKSSTADGSAPDGKPLSAPQEKAALELGSDYANIKRLSSTFKDDYAGDLRSSIQREFGKVAGGAAPQSTQDMTRWWSDQAYLDELPTRHALFGAALTATEQKSWRDAAISPSLAPSVIRERLATRQRIYEDAAGRMRASAVAGGKSAKQFDAATGDIGRPQQPAPTRRKWDATKGDFE